MFHESICLLKEIQMKNFNREINEVYINFKKNPDSINCITKMFEKLRPWFLPDPHYIFIIILDRKYFEELETVILLFYVN